MEYLEEVAVLIARQLAAGHLKVDRSKKNMTGRIMDFALKYDFVKDKIFSKAKDQVMKMTGGLYPAPLKVNISSKIKRSKYSSVNIILNN